MLIVYHDTFQAEDLFSEIKGQFVDSLEEQTWMDDKTRQGARDKVSTKRFLVKYPYNLNISKQRFDDNDYP